MRSRLADTIISRTAVLLLILPLFAVGASSQHTRTAFDFHSPLEFPHRITLLARGDMDGDGIPDLVTAAAGRVTVSVQGKTSYEWKKRAIRTEGKPVAMATGRVNGDGRDDLVIYTADPPTVNVYLSSPSGTPGFSSSVRLPQEFQHMVIADVDGDRNADILLFGKKTLGVTVLTGNGRGIFTGAKILFPEQSVSLLSVFNLDDDGVPDLVAVNWIRNRVETYSGFGGMNFSEPAILQFQQEPMALSVGDMNGDLFRDLLIGFGEPPSFQIFRGDPSGSFSAMSRGDLPGAPARLRIGDADGDGLNDVLAFFPGTGVVGVGFQVGKDGILPMQNYFVGTEAGDAVFFRDGRQRYLNCAVLYEGRRELRLLHTRTPPPAGDSGLNLVAGREPTDVLLSDVNGDGWTDAVLAQGADAAVNFFLNNRRGTFFGMYSVPLPEPARVLLPVRGDPAAAGIVCVRNGPSLIHCTFIDPGDESRQTVTIPGEIPGVVIGAEARPGGSSKRIYVLRDEDMTESGGVFAYDVSGARPYEETEITAVLRGGVAASIANDINGDGRLDLVTVSVADSGGSPVISWFRQDSIGFTLTGSIPFGVPENYSGRFALWSHDLNGDGHDDLIINLPRPENTLFVALALGDTSFAPAELTLTDVRTDVTKHILTATDFDADGKTDLVLLNERTNTIQFFPGDGRGGFERPVNLMSGKGVTAFSIADLNRDGEMELVVAAGESRGLSVTSFHHPLYKKPAGNGNN